MRLEQLFSEWEAGTCPRPQTALEFKAAVDDFIDFAGDVPVEAIDADLIYDYRDAAARLPATMPRADRALPFRARVAKHAVTKPKCASTTLKRRVGAVQALLTYDFRQRWISANADSRIVIVGFTKNRRRRRSFEDHELATLCAAPLFVDPAGWRCASRNCDATIFWLFLLGITSGARLEEVGQVALAEVKRDGAIVYLDIKDNSFDEDAPQKIVKTEESGVGRILTSLNGGNWVIAFTNCRLALNRVSDARPGCRDNRKQSRSRRPMVGAGDAGDAYRLAIVAASAMPSVAGAQATTRECTASEEPGPACLMARTELPSLRKANLFWHLDRFASKEVAERAAAAASTVVQSFGSTWLFTIARERWRPRGGEHVTDIGPLPRTPSSVYAAEYLRSVFNPGTTASLHVHSGPEAFYAVDGDTCLETPDGVQTGRGPGNSLMIKAGPPMLLMAIGKVPRRGFALVLHDASLPPTTLTQAWHPMGLCARQLAADQAR